MHTIEVFYDYICPYCYKGLKEFEEMISKYPDINVVYKPCESHPRPEKRNVYSDVASSIAYYLGEKKLDIKKYNELLYKAHFEDKIRIDDFSLLAEAASFAGANKEEILNILNDGKYLDKVAKNNRHVWLELSIPAVPSYKIGDKLLCSGGGMLVDIDEVERAVRETV